MRGSVVRFSGYERFEHFAVMSLFTALVVVHVVRIVMSLVTGRTQLTMVPTRRDFDDAVQTLRYYFGMRDTPDQQNQRHDHCNHYSF